MLTIATLLWDRNQHSFAFSRSYNEEWVIRLYAGVARNLTMPFRFVLFTERNRDLPPEIIQERMKTKRLDYGACIEPYRFGVPMILMGLDTIIVGNIDHLAAYCSGGDKIALPKDPFHPVRACNGVSLVPEGQQYVWRNWNGENDMEWMRKQPHVFIDDLFPDHVVSYKGTVKKNGLGDARIVYFHGKEKPNELQDVPWVRQHWNGE